MHKYRATILGLLVLSLHEEDAGAADTVEVWAKGPTDAELYVGLEGIGPEKEGRNTRFEYLAGFGITDRISAYLMGSLDASWALTGLGAGFGAGVLGTPLDTDHVDLDLFIDVAACGPGLRGFSAGPAFELNLDLEPDLALWGVYLRAGVPVEGIKLASPAHPGHGIFLSIPVVLGTYYTVRGSHQILLEADVTFHALPSGVDRKVEVGGASLGYNVVLGRVAELITEVFLDVPQRGEMFSVSVMVGVVLTLPVSGLVVYV